MSHTTVPVPADAVPLPIRFLDCLLVLAFLPFGLAAGLPALGLLAGAGMWIAQRALGQLIDARAAAATDARRATAIQFIGVMGRPFLLALTILAVGLLGEKRDGLAAAILVLVAFTVYLILSIVLRPQRKSST
ncbi:MAG: hypothetical protein QOE86_2244 [Solirubrobacteraceae bacterium]|jgi:hypothetical protein|nr:hypothetical protein [Solirubrobacteraceae bacterium]